MKTPQLYSMVPMAPSHNTVLFSKSLSTAAGMPLLIFAVSEQSYIFHRVGHAGYPAGSGGSFPAFALLYLGQELQHFAHLRVSLESLPLKIRSFPTQLFCGLVLTAASLVLGACHA